MEFRGLTGTQLTLPPHLNLLLFVFILNASRIVNSVSATYNKMAAASDELACKQSSKDIAMIGQVVHCMMPPFLSEEMRLKSSALRFQFTALPALWVTWPAFSLGLSPGPQIRTFTCSHTAIRSASLTFYGLHARNPCAFVYVCVGVGGVSVSIEGASKADIKCTDSGREDGVSCVTYQPTRPGLYVVNVMFSSQHVHGQLLQLCCASVVMECGF